MSALNNPAARVALVALCGLFAPACSLLGLSDFEIPPCADDTECDPLNALEGIDPATACELYQCTNQGACVLRARDSDDDGETSVACGGGDCDDADPDAFFGAPVVAREIVSPVTRPSWLHFGQSQAGAATVTYSAGSGNVGFDVLSVAREPGAPTFADFAMDADVNQPTNAAPIQLMCPVGTVSPTTPPDEPINPTHPDCTTNADCDDGVFCNGFEVCAAATGCRDPQVAQCTSAGQSCDETADQCIRIGMTMCDVGELAVAHARDDEVIAAAVNTNGCATGQLRVGWMTTGEANAAMGIPGPNVLLRGGLSRAPSFFGVDLVDGRCSGASRDDGIAGVSSVAVGALPAEDGRRRPQGLVAYLGAPICRLRGTCTDEPGMTGDVGVELIGAWIEQAPSSNNRAATWVSLSGSGAPQILPTQTSGVASPAVVATPGSDGGYLVAYGASGGGVAARFVGALDELDEVLDTPPFPTQLTGPANESRVTPALTSLGTEITIGSAAADFVSGAPSADGSVVVLAWLEGGAVSMARLDRAGGTLTAGAATSVSSAGASAPEVAWVPSVCGPDCGGWAITWAEGGNGRLLRIAENGDPIDASPVDLGPGPTRVQAFEDNGTLRLAWHDDSSNALVVSNGQCPPPRE